MRPIQLKSDSPTALCWLVQCDIFTPFAGGWSWRNSGKKYLALTPGLLVSFWNTWREVRGNVCLISSPLFQPACIFSIRVLAAPTSSLVAAVKTSSDYSAPRKLGLILEPGRGQEVRSSPLSGLLFKRLFQFPSVKQLAPRGGKANTKRVPLLHHQFRYTCQGYGRLFCWCSGY